MTITERIDNITLVQDFNTILPPPKSVKIELTSRCNLQCKFCAHGQEQGKNLDMEFELFKRLTKEIRTAGVEELGLFYIGESFLYERLVDAVQYAKKDCGFPYVFLTTNGVLADYKIISQLMQAGLDSLKWSLNFTDKEQFKEITGANERLFNNVIHNIEMAYCIREAYGQKTKLYASSILYDGEQLKKMEELVERIKPFVDEHYWLPLYSFGGITKKAVAGNPGRVDKMRPVLPCWSVFKEGHITHDGLMSACCFDSLNAWVMADLKKVSFVEGWNSTLYQQLRKKHLDHDVRNTHCEKCIYRNE